MLPALIQPLVYIEYQMRKEYIVAELCAERFAVVNTCDGRCFLVDRFNENQRRASEEKEQNIKPVEIKLQLLKLAIELERPSANFHSKARATFSPSLYSYLAVSSIDEPPKG